LPPGLCGLDRVNFLPYHLPREQILQFIIKLICGTRGLEGWGPPTREVREARRLRITRIAALRDRRPALP
jgi:hypothetical protein